MGIAAQAHQERVARRGIERLRPLLLAACEFGLGLVEFAQATDIERAWSAPTTAPRDRKELLRMLLEDVTIAIHRGEHRVHLTLRWRGGALTELDVELPRFRPSQPKSSSCVRPSQRKG
jgi:hypothetical protein